MPGPLLSIRSLTLAAALLCPTSASLAASVALAGHAPTASPPGTPDDQQVIDDLKQAIDDLDPEDNRGAYALSTKLVDAEGGAGFKALRDKWATIKSPAAKQQIMQSFFAKRLPAEFDENAKKDRLHKRLVDVLDLGARDTSAAVQASALRWLKKVSLKDFAESFDAYYPWFEAQFGKDANDTFTRSVADWVKKARETKGEDVRALADFIEENGEIVRDTGVGRRAAAKAGWTEVLSEWLDGGEAETQTAMRLIGGMRMTRPELERIVIPRIKAARSPGTRTWAVAVMGDARAAWAVDELHKVLADNFNNPDDLRLLIPPMCRTLATLGDAKSIPILIATMEAEGSAAATQTINVAGLAPLTGVKVKDGMDAAWWRNWWEKNRARFAEDVRALEVPPSGKAIADKEKPGTPREEVDTGADVLSIPSADVRAGFDNDKRYFLIGANKENTPGPDGYKLLLILPGGDGSASFNLFARRVYKNALPDAGKGWLVAQLVAPKWEEKQFDRIVWPLEKVPFKGEKKKNKFSTEEFADAVVTDAKTRVDIDPKNVYVMGWSSGGPACYALMLREKTPFCGALVAMSVFKPEQTDGLQFAATAGGDKGAGGKKRFAILHSEEDQTVPVRWSNDAFEMLSKSKAKAQFKPYPGGHGWQGDVFGNIRSGIEFITKGE